jgi:ABC-2 type transport system ATP-binding protein
VMIGNGRIVADGPKEQLLAGSGVLVRGDDAGLLAQALRRHRLAATARPPDGGFLVDAEPLAVGRAAAEARVVLTELRRADGGGLEELFLAMTAAHADAGAAHSTSVPATPTTPQEISS